VSTPTYTARVLTRISDVTEAQWDAHLPEGRHPFLSWRFLKACEESGSATEETGWAPRHIWLEDEDGTALGCAPLYAKTHSQGEYVFDHSWANAMAQAGMDYYPKLQGCVPFTPATGPRLLAKTPEAKTGLISTMIQACQDWDYSGVHLTFLQDEDLSLLKDIGFAHREDRQFHFINRGYDSFDDFLASLASRNMAFDGATPIAAALNYIGSDALFGRNWGCLAHKPFLHFELCYYQAIEAGIDLGLPKVEAGAQGEHKLARGYEPVATHSAHYLAHAGLRNAVSDYLKRERHAVEYEIDVLGKHTPFKKQT